MQRIPFLRTSLLQKLVLVLAIAALAASCGDDADTVVDDGPGDSGTRPSLAGGWILQSLTVDGAVIALPADDIEMTIELGQISGTLGCNSFSGSIDAADDGTLAIGDLSQTEMACLEDGRMEFESTYGQALTAATGWEADPNGITFLGPTVAIGYAPAPPVADQPLVGTVWSFDTIYTGTGPDRAATNRADMAGVTLVIDGSEAAFAGPDCLGTTIAVEVDGISEGTFRTGAGGDLPDSTGCAAVGDALAGLTAASGYMIDENRLTFIGDPGETVGFVTDAS